MATGALALALVDAGRATSEGPPVGHSDASVARPASFGTSSIVRPARETRPTEAAGKVGSPEPVAMKDGEARARDPATDGSRARRQTTASAAQTGMGASLAEQQRSARGAAEPPARPDASLAPSVGELIPHRPELTRRLAQKANIASDALVPAPVATRIEVVVSPVRQVTPGRSKKAAPKKASRGRPARSRGKLSGRSKAKTGARRRGKGR